MIAAMVRKYVEAAERGEHEVVLWGTGNPSREFLYVDDAARALILAAERYDSSDPMNIGTGRETRIRDLAETIAALTGYEGETVWDSSKPDGQPTRYLDVSRARERIGFEAEVGSRRACAAPSRASGPRPAARPLLEGLGPAPAGQRREEEPLRAVEPDHDRPVAPASRPRQADLLGLVELLPDVGRRLAARVVAEADVRVGHPVDAHPVGEAQVEVVVGCVDPPFVERADLARSLGAEDEGRRGDVVAQQQVAMPAPAGRAVRAAHAPVRIREVEASVDDLAVGASLEMLDGALDARGHDLVVAIDPRDQSPARHRKALVDGVRSGRDRAR